ALTDEKLMELEHIGRKIEEHFGCPQDIEWCLVDDTFYIVQSRPITTLFPIPEANDQENHVYVSVDHQQMMTDPMKPLGLSFFLLTTRALMRKAGGRLFVDVTPLLASAAIRESIVDVMGKGDPLIKDALMTIIERGDFIQSLPDDKQEKTPGKSNQGPSLADFQTLNEYDPAIVSDLIKRSETLIEELKQNIQTKSGSDVCEFVSGQETQDALYAYLDKYGMRCAGEIDITRPRWSEKPTALVHLILSNIKNFEPGESKRRFEQGRQEALKKEQELLDRLKQLPDGEQKAKETKRMISLIRNFSGYREYPKYGMVQRYFVYKQALLKEAEHLVQANVLHEKEDIYYLTFEELRE